MVARDGRRGTDRRANARVVRARAAGVLGPFRCADEDRASLSPGGGGQRPCPLLGRSARLRGRGRLGREPRREGSGERGPGVCPEDHSAGAPRHGLRARAGQPERPGGRTNRARARRGLADCERDDARRRRRRRDRGDDGARRGRVEPPRAARAPHDRRGRGWPRRRQRPRPEARHGHRPRQSRQRGRREADRRVRREHRYVDPRREAARGPRRRIRSRFR